MDVQSPSGPHKTTDREYYIFALKIIGDFGANIAIPVVVLVEIGQYLDGRYAVGPLATVAGFVGAALISGFRIYRKARIYGEKYQQMNKT